MAANKQFDVVISCANLSSAEIVKAEIKHKLGYDADILDVKVNVK